MPQLVLEGPVVVIDDDLRAWRAADFADLQGVLDDPDVDDFKALWGFAVAQQFVVQTDDEALRIERLGQDEVIHQLVLAPTFPGQHGDLWDRYFRATVETRHSGLAWYRSVVAAVEKRGAELTTYSAHPEPAEIDEAKLVVIDLILDDDPDPLGKATDYLRNLYVHRRDAGLSLPLVILVSQNAAELEEHRLEFRYDAQISASMLRIVAKAAISDAAQGPIRVELLWQQMVDEQELATVTQDLFAAMSEALKDADVRLRRLFWNLDCDALLRMYQACVDDGASFADYLVEFVSRSVAWEIRNHEALRTSIDLVGGRLNDRATSGAEDLARRFHSAGQRDEAAMQELMHQFHWIPLAQTVSLSDIDADTLPAELDQQIPYGSVLAFGQIQVGQKVFVHITQPCDLLRFTNRFEVDSLVFVEGRVVSYGEASDADSKWIIRALKSGGAYFDVEISLKRTRALSARECIDFHRDREAVIIGRLRADTTREVGHQLSRYLSRIDRPRFADMRSVHYNVLVGEKGAGAGFFTDQQGNRVTARAILRTVSGKDKECFHLLDGASEEIAIWCQERHGGTGVQAADVAHALKEEIMGGATHVEIGEHCDIRVIKNRKQATKNLGRMNSNKPVGIVLIPIDIAADL